MDSKPKWLTLEFWAAILSAGALLIVTLGIVSQEEANTWVGLLTGLVAAVLPIAALVLGYSQVRASALAYGLLAVETPAWMTAEFWMTLATAGLMVLVGLRVVDQQQANTWKELLGPLVAAVLAIAAYIRGRLQVKAAAVERLARRG